MFGKHYKMFPKKMFTELLVKYIDIKFYCVIDVMYHVPVKIYSLIFIM